MSGIGCHVYLANYAQDLDAVALLFSESQGRAVVACRNEHTDEVLARASRHGVLARQIGRTETAVFLIERDSVPLVRTTSQELSRIWRSAFALLLGGDSVDDVIRGVGEEAPEVVPR